VADQKISIRQSIIGTAIKAIRQPSAVSLGFELSFPHHGGGGGLGQAGRRCGELSGGRKGAISSIDIEIWPASVFHAKLGDYSFEGLVGTEGFPSKLIM